MSGRLIFHVILLCLFLLQTQSAVASFIESTGTASLTGDDLLWPSARKVEHCPVDDSSYYSVSLSPAGPIGMSMFTDFRSEPRAIRAVQRNLTLFTEDIQDRFGLYLSRSGRFIGLMREILMEEGLPEEIVFLPMIESGFNLNAYSRSRAAGPWQFITATGRRYGLKVDYWVDERRDPVKSTRAAARYLRDLYKMFDSWELAFAAYNAGENRIKRAMKRTGKSDYWNLTRTKHIRLETKQYVAKFIAARLIAERPDEYGFKDLKYLSAFEYDTVKLPYQLTLEDISKATGVPRSTLRELNPELRHSVTPPGKAYPFRLPVGKGPRLLGNMPKKFKNTPSARLARHTYSVDGGHIYVVRRGDNLWDIARRIGISLKTILRANDFRRPYRIFPGQKIFIPLVN